MMTLTMTNPLETLRKLKGRSWSELRTRGEQLFAGYTEKVGLSNKVPTDKELFSLFEKKYFSTKNPTSEELFNEFFANGEFSFFQVFNQKSESLRAYRRLFSKKVHQQIIEKANRLTEGKFGVLGFQSLDMGEEINWHYEPLSGKIAPLKHWKEFDELSIDETGDKKIVWEINRHQHFFTLGVAYWLTKDERYTATFARHLDSWMKQNPPGMGVNWISSLEVSFRAISWIWGLQFFQESPNLSPHLLKEVLKFLYLHGRHIETYLSTYYSPNTHLTGEALGLYYLGTQLPFFQRAAHWRKLGHDILMEELDRQILPDGVYFEQSTWYQRYTADFYTHFLILKTLNAEETDPRLQEKLAGKLQLVLDFLMYVTRPDGTTPLIGDDDGGKILPHSITESNNFRGTLTTASILFGRGDYKFVGRGFAEETFWLLGVEGYRRFESLPAHLPKDNSRTFNSGGYFVMRDGWADTDNYLLIDCGIHGALNCGHSHADALAIDVAVGGKTILVDPGTYTYHESQMWRDFFRSTTGHNTLTIDSRSSSEPGGKFSWESQAEAQPKAWLSQDRFDYFEGLHRGYERLENGSATHHRSILFLKNDYWIMRDYVETFGTHDYQLNFHFNSETNPIIKSNGTWSVEESSATDSGLKLVTFGDNGQWQKKESWVSPNFGMKVNAPFLRFVSEGVGSQEFFTFMLPTDGGVEAPEVYETEISGGRAFLIKYRGYKDLFVFGDGEGQLIRTEFFDTDFRFLWARLGVDESLPEEFVLIDGTNFHLAGREVVNYPQKLSFVIARRLGNRLNVRTNESIFTVSLPQKSRSNTLVLKDSEQSA